MINFLKFRITGTYALLQNNPAAMLAPPPPPGPKGPTEKPPLEQQAEAAAYRLKSGQLYFPAIAFRKALLGACKNKTVKPGGKGRGIQVVTFMKATAFTEALEAPLFHPKTWKPITDFDVDVRRVVMKGTGGAIARARPLIREWATEIVMECDTDFVTAAMILELLTLAGKMIGVGDYRPERGGPFGRFMVQLQEFAVN